MPCQKSCNGCNSTEIHCCVWQKNHCYWAFWQQRPSSADWLLISWQRPTYKATSWVILILLLCMWESAQKARVYVCTMYVYKWFLECTHTRLVTCSVWSVYNEVEVEDLSGVWWSRIDNIIWLSTLPLALPTYVFCTLTDARPHSSLSCPECSAPTSKTHISSLSLWLYCWRREAWPSTGNEWTHASLAFSVSLAFRY